MASYDTIVIGLGASGAAAASTLARAGRKVLALEAQDRIGGRVCTMPFGDGVVEVGAEWIHGTVSSPVYELGIKNNISLLPQDLAFKVHLSDGSTDKEALFNELVEHLLVVQENPPEKPEPLGQFLSRKILEYIEEKHPELKNEPGFIQSFLEFADLLVNNYEATTSWNEITSLSNYRTLDGEQHISWHKNGYKTMFELLLNTYKNGPGYPTLDIKLNTEVTQIQWPQEPKDNVVVTARDGTKHTAKTAIVTLSIGVLKERHATLFNPPLPAEKAQNIQNISMGVIGKIILLFPETFWPKNYFFGFLWKEGDKKKVAASDWWTTKIFGISSPLGNQKALTVWTCGAGTRLVETLPDHVVQTKLMEVIRKFMGASRTIPEPVGMLRSSWYSNPYTRGSYTFDDVNMPQHPNVRVELSQPLVDSSGAPRLLFAGEATDKHYFSTVHGAVSSGYREANRLLPASKM